MATKEGISTDITNQPVILAPQTSRDTLAPMAHPNENFTVTPPLIAPSGDAIIIDNYRLGKMERYGADTIIRLFISPDMKLKQVPRSS